MGQMQETQFFRKRSSPSWETLSFFGDEDDCFPAASPAPALSSNVFTQSIEAAEPGAGSSRLNGGVSDNELLMHRSGVAIIRRLSELAVSYHEDFGRPLDSHSIVATRSVALLAVEQGLRLPWLSAEPSGVLLATWKLGRESATIRLVNLRIAHFTMAMLAPDGQSIHRSWGAVDPRIFFKLNQHARRIARQNGAA